MTEDIKLVHRQETFNDLAVRELADTRAACYCRIQFGRCTEDECKTCVVNRQFQSCYSQLNDYDKTRFIKYLSTSYQSYSLKPSLWYKHRTLKIYYLKWLLLFILFVLLPMFLFFVRPSDKPNYTYDRADVNAQIIFTLIDSRKGIKDLNDDRLINCIDYAVSFKRTWDYNYPEIKNACKIVRNYNTDTGFHHLFCFVYDIPVETWCSNIYMFEMENNWGNEYDPSYNIFGETYLWLVRCRK